MATGTVTIKDRCRLCYTRLKDPNSTHHKFWCSRENHRIYNIYHRRPIRYRDLIVRYLCIQLPEHDQSDQYSRLLCGTCATALNKLDQAYRTFQQTQRVLRSKYRKTSHIVHYQLDQQRLKHLSNSGTTRESEEKVSLPKRQSKRKGEPKHIDQTVNSTRKNSLNNGTPLSILDEKREHSRGKTILDENPKKKFKSEEIPTCINLLKSTMPIEISNTKNVLPLNNKIGKSTKGNHIERIAVSLLSVRFCVSFDRCVKSRLFFCFIFLFCREQKLYRILAIQNQLSPMVQIIIVSRRNVRKVQNEFVFLFFSRSD